MSAIWISIAGIFGASVLGSALGFGIKALPHKWNDALLGYCAGVMLAASTLGLIVPGFEASPSSMWLLVAVVVVGGAMFLNVLDLATPHLHHITGLDPEEHHRNSSLSKVLLFVMAIALHKFPEGMAAGVSMADTGDQAVEWTVSIAIAVQNIPEGMVIIAPLLVAGVSRARTFIIALAIALLEALGVGAGYGLGYLFNPLLPYLLAFAGGAMLYVTSDEMIPETHAHGYQKQATYALLLGFITLVILDLALAET